MTEANKNTSEPSQSPSKIQFWNRVQMILILVVFAAPVVAAFFYKPSSFTNYGDIYQPVRPVDNLILQGDDGVVELDSLRRQWVFLVVARDECNTECEANILKMRQLRFMQNNDMTRIRTVFLHTGLPVAIATDLAAKYSPIEAYAVESEAYKKWSEILILDDAPDAAQVDRLYIIDPAGNLMMSYPPSADPNIMKKDIKRLLKASQIG